MEKNWRAVYVSSRQEKKVNNLLSERGIETYLPLIKTLRQWSDRKKMVEFPLIPGYVFVRSSEMERLAILQTRGVVNFVRNNGKIGIVYNKEIETIKQLIALGYHMEAFPSTSKINQGDKIKIASGTLKNLEGFVIEERESNFFEILIDGIGYNVRVKLPYALLIKSAI